VKTVTSILFTFQFLNMKYRLLLFTALLFFSVFATAQLKSATLQASGLTCAMCSNAINKALSKLEFVSSVEPDLNKSAFIIQFKQGAAVDFDLMRKKVEEAGFSVAKLEVVAMFDQFQLKKNQVSNWNGMEFYLLQGKDQTLNGEYTITILDKHFVLPKEYKRLSALTAAESYKTGMSNGKRIYHIGI